MKKYLSLLRYEFKTIVRDPINLFMLMFPLIVLFLSSYLFPLIISTLDQTQQYYKHTMLIFLIIILAFGTFLVAAMVSFMLIDHKDENTLNTIAVTPLRAAGYIKFKMTYLYILSVFDIILILVGTKLIASEHYVINGIRLLDNLNFVEIITYALTSAIFAPLFALMVAAFSKNKVEGFAYIKSTGIIALLPILMLLDNMQDGWQYLLGVFPNFWAIKSILLELLPNNNSANLPNFYLYLLIGAIYNSFLVLLAYRFFLKKAKF